MKVPNWRPVTKLFVKAVDMHRGRRLYDISDTHSDWSGRSDKDSDTKQNNIQEDGMVASTTRVLEVMMWSDVE